MNKKIRVLAISPFFLPGYKGGGPIKTIKNLFVHAGHEIEFDLITGDRDLGDYKPYESVRYDAWQKVGGARVFYVRKGLKGCLQIYKIAKSKSYDIVYINSFFSIIFSLYPLMLARAFGKRVICSPRGQFSKGALFLGAFKKHVFISLFRLLKLHRGIVFQASTRYEAGDIREAIGGDVDVKVAENISSNDFISSIPARVDGPLNIVFVSRISEKKNLFTAIEVLKKLKLPIRYDIYGPIEDDVYWNKCKEVIRELPENVCVEYKGTLNPEDVVPTIAQYDLFFFPTMGENYGHVVVEALCAGLPLLISDTTPWRHLKEAGIGWDLPLDDLRFFGLVLEEVSKMSSDEHLRMRENVLAWAMNKFSQRDAIEANIGMFRYAIEK